MQNREEYMSIFKTTRRVAVSLVAAAAATFGLQANAGGHGIDVRGVSRTQGIEGHCPAYSSQDRSAGKWSGKCRLQSGPQGFL